MATNQDSNNNNNIHHMASDGCHGSGSRDVTISNNNNININTHQQQGQHLSINNILQQPQPQQSLLSSTSVLPPLPPNQRYQSIVKRTKYEIVPHLRITQVILIINNSLLIALPKKINIC
eukprot:UN10397